MATKTYEDLVREQKQLDKTNPGKMAGTKKQWEEAWKKQQIEQFKTNVSREDHTDPTPVLIDKISALPIDSARRRNFENIKATIENSTANNGSGMDALTRESYKDLQRVVKQSDMLQNGIKKPLPGPNELTGTENGTIVSNLQSWQAPIANAMRPVSDAMGSHADTSSSINKNAMGPAQLLPQSSLNLTKGITGSLVDDVEKPFKSSQKAMLVQMPSKLAGSLRHIMTAADPVLSVPFEIASDTYNGLRAMIKQISGIIDGIMTKITQFAISAVGGLVDGLFPSGVLKAISKFIHKFANLVKDLFALLGGFSALAAIASNVLSELPLGCSGSIFGVNSAKMRDVSGTRNGRVPSILPTVIGTLGGGVGQGLGNLGFVLSSMGGSKVGGLKIGKQNLGDLTKNMSHPNQLQQSIFDTVILNLLNSLHKMCSFGYAGNAGFSVGATFDFLQNSSFTKCMAKYATHASIVSQNFNKQSTSIGAYAKEYQFSNAFEQLPYVPGSQGNKGVIMVGPGGTQGQKVFRI